MLCSKSNYHLAWVYSFPLIQAKCICLMTQAKPKARSTKSLGPGHRKEPAYKSRRFHINVFLSSFSLSQIWGQLSFRKTITTLGAVDIIPSLPEDQPTVIYLEPFYDWSYWYWHQVLWYWYCVILSAVLRIPRRKELVRSKNRRKNMCLSKRKLQWKLITDQKKIAVSTLYLFFSAVIRGE